MSIHESYTVREWFSVVQEVAHDGGPSPEAPLVKAAVGVIITIRSPAADTRPTSHRLTDPSAAIGRELGRRALALLGGRPAESYGKGGIAGIAGEQEHVVACVTTVFGNAFRDAIGGGAAWISSTTKVGAAGTSIDIPLAYKDEVYVRSHYDTITLTVPDGPRPDELLIVVAVATGGRVHARVGGMTVEEAAN